MEKVEKQTVTNLASVAGALLGLISGGYIFVEYALLGVKGAGVVTAVLWIAKFVGCILLMRWAMRYLVRHWDGATNADTRRLGVLTAAFSALITAAAGYVALTYVFPGAINEQLDSMMGIYAKSLDSNTMTAVTKMMDNYNIINFFTQLFWCFIYGWVLSTILSRNIPPVDPFAQFRKAAEEEKIDEQ